MALAGGPTKRDPMQSCGKLVGAGCVKSRLRYKCFPHAGKLEESALYKVYSSIISRMANRLSLKDSDFFCLLIIDISEFCEGLRNDVV